jgi:drug/metabolite transporter (DMT)-like permease
VAAVALGLLSGLAWGFADFLGGIQSRRLPLLAVVLGSQLAGLALIATVMAVRLDFAPGGEFAIYAALSGVAGAVGLAAFYRGLAVGAMGIVAPISATAAVIPVTVGVATGERPSTAQAVGVGLALAGVVLASREAGTETGRDGAVAKGAGLAVLAAIGFGCFFLTMDRASNEDVLWAIFGNRVTSVTLLSGACLVARPNLDLSREDAAKVAAIGILDISANTLFAFASTHGLVSVVAVLGSLYPVVTVLLARLLLHERIAVLQRAGAIGALAGVVLISAG